jgi:hypothetical protein
MSNYNFSLWTVKYVPVSKLEDIKKEWMHMESGSEMTLFQTYEWYCMLQQCYIPKDNYNYESVFAMVYKGKKCYLIAPLWIIKHNFRILNKRGIYFLGRDGCSDYLNMIYKEFEPKAFDLLVEDLQAKYKVKYFYFEGLMESSSLYKHIVKTAANIYHDDEEPYVCLETPSSVQTYNALLSKHSRQNFRTANNRLAKDGKILIFNFDDDIVDKQKCLNIRESKLSIEYAKFSWYKIHKYRLINRIRFRFPRYMPLLTYHASKVMTAYIGEDLCAYFNYAYDDEHKAVVIFSAGTNLEYARYSPGMLLMYNYIKVIIEGQNSILIDFTRGNEMYKLSLGGKEKKIHHLKVSFH